jgi:hypothetical protein
MVFRLLFVISSLAVAFLDGCGGTSPSDTCIPGISVVCECPTGQHGAQTCTAAGAFAACVCAASTEDDGGVGEASEAGSSDAPVAAVGSDAQVATLPPGSFVVTGSMTVARDDFTATLLGNEKVLMAGGWGIGLMASAELYDPSTGIFSATGSMKVARTGHTATLLSDGRVLIAGGVGDDGNSLASTELYDPASETFVASGYMIASRLNHTATLLANGTVLIAGGTCKATTDGGDTTTVLVSAELYDPLTGMFAATGHMTAERSSHTATLLGNRMVLIVGGTSEIKTDGGSTTTVLASVELYDPEAGTFAATGSTTVARQNHTATLLLGGAVLIAGGSDGITALASAELYDPVAGTFTAAGSTTLSRLGHTATLLRDGTVLMAGGNSGNARAELYDPGAGGFTTTGSMTLLRWSHTATLLGNGAVLIAGGSGVLGYLAGAQLYR